MRLTKKTKYGYENESGEITQCSDKLGPLENIEEKLGIDLNTFLRGVEIDNCFMEITNDKKFDFCGDAYYGIYEKEDLLRFIQELIFMYWALTKEELL